MSETIQVKTRDQIAESDKWNVGLIYPDVKAWEADFTSLHEEVARIPAFRGRLKEPEQLLNFFRLDERLAQLAGKLDVYANLRSDEDTSNTAFLALKSKIGAYLAEVEAALSFFVPEILSYPDGTIENEIKAEPKLELYRFELSKILKAKPHTLDQNGEKILASFTDSMRAPENTYTVLSNADLTFDPIHDEKGREAELNESNYYRFIISKDRRVRKEAFQSLFRGFGKFRNTFSSLLSSSVKNFTLEAKLRHYPSALEASLDPNDISTEVYRKAVETIHANLGALHRYVAVKKKLLGLPDIHMYDLYVPVIDVPDVRYGFDEAVRIVEEGLAPLGKEYLELFGKGVRSGWIDRYPNKNKRSGAYSSGCYDTQPYVLLNYDGTLDDVSTLAHEMGHSLHSYYSNHTQPRIYADYVLFCAEVASTTNEALLIHHLIDKETDRKQKLYLINSQLEQIRTTVFRQIMFAEFELFTHEKAEQGIPLTADDLSAFWHEINVKYYGPEMTVDPEIDMEWARIPHFYSDFYVYQYATGYAAANSFANSILGGAPDAVEKYKGFLKSGGSDYPINILRRAGVNMETAKPMQDTMDTFQNLLSMLEKETG